MKSLRRKSTEGRMSSDAYAGFLKLWLKPAHASVQRSVEIDAYLEYANDREPLSRGTRRMIGLTTDQAA
jgi:hypothetical protein